MEKSIFTIRKSDASFPLLLHEIPDMPEKLHCLGQKLNPEDEYFAIVGTRHATPYGKQMAEKFSHALAQAGCTIVSGLAYGIDAVAHEAALAAGGKTVAVLGAGLNHITPTCNFDLSRRIEKNGTIITEYEHDIRPTKFTFPKRNRIIAGMSSATLVIEAPERSGALITARLALEYNREVFALPSNITQETGRGANLFIRDGRAYLVTNVEDIFDFMGLSQKLSALGARSKLTGPEKEIIELLKGSPMEIGEIVAQTALETAEVNTIISLLAIKGFVKTSGSYVFMTL